MKIFISHSSQDKELVTMFINLLTNHYRIDIDNIFCTSLDGTLRVGEDFIKCIKENLSDADIVIFLISENYIFSKFCLMEMGAAWAFKDNIVPFIVPPLDFDVLSDTPMNGIQGIVLNNEEALFQNFYARMLVEKELIKRLSFSKEQELLNGIKNFSNNVMKYVNLNFGFNFSDAHVIPVAQNGDPDSVSMMRDEDIYKLQCDFTSSTYYPIPSNFMSLVFRFMPHKNWSNINAESSVNFECRSSDCSVSEVILELKSGNDLFKFYEKRLNISQEYKKIAIPLRLVDMPKNNLRDVSEICFTVRPNFVKDFKGTIEIRNIQYCDDIISV